VPRGHAGPTTCSAPPSRCRSVETAGPPLLPRVLGRRAPRHFWYTQVSNRRASIDSTDHLVCPHWDCDRPRTSAELRKLIGEMSRANHLWGAPHIHGELLKLGFTLAQSTVARYMYRGPPSQGWRTFLTNHADGIAAIDLFVLPTITFRLLYCLVILRHGRRLWVSFGVTTNPTAEWISRQITEAFPWNSAPRYLIRDRDTAYGPLFVQRLHAMGIRDKPIAPRSPWQNPYVERLIGTIRRECLDHMIVFGQAHLRRVLGKFAAYYNESRIHRSLDKDAPFHRAIERVGAITSQPVLGGLHHQYCRI
jgi:transposase InsO family protein